MPDDPPTGGPDDPLGPGGFGGAGIFGDLIKMLQGASLGGAGQARDVARAVATGGESEPNIDPAQRMAIGELVRVAELRVARTTGLEAAGGAPLRVEVVNRTQWSDRTMADYAPLFAELGKSVTSTGLSSTDAGEADDDPMSAMLAGITRMIAPMMLTLTTGALVGRLAQQAFGGYWLPVPRPKDAPLLVALPNVDSFAKEWSLDAGDLRLWVCVHEALFRAVFGVTHVRERIDDLLVRHASGFDTNPQRLEELLGDFDPTDAGPEGLAQLQESLGNPELILGAVRSSAQQALQPELTALIASITGFVDHTMDLIGAELIGSYGRLTEAMRRHRVEASASDRFVERMLGLELDRAQYDRGASFAAGVVERAGYDGLLRLFSDPANLPTPNEVDAAGLWLARIDL